MFTRKQERARHCLRAVRAPAEFELLVRQDRVVLRKRNAVFGYAVGILTVDSLVQHGVRIV